MEDNSHAGQGAVVLDIGGDIGALVVLMPAALAGEEVEARPLGRAGDDEHHHHHHHDGDEHEHHHGKLEHVAVLERPMPDGGRRHSAVFPALSAGTYELYLRPAGPVRLTVDVPGGAVADAVWP